ncbi:MAG: GAF domain-containing sensor histidine kinase, partial [Prochlorotrichaceae cyanobacterium]
MDPNTVLFCRLDGSNSGGREQHRLLCLEESGLLSLSSPPVLRELLETAVNLLDFPIAWIGLMELNVLRLQCTLGLSEFGLTHNLSQQRSLPRLDSFCSYVVDSEKALIIEDTLAHPVFAQSPLTHTYGIRSYLGAPLIWTNEDQECYCLGTIALMDRTPRRLLPSDRQWVQVLSRWCMSEYLLATALKPAKVTSNALLSNDDSVSFSEAQIRLQTIHDLSQSCHNPMTAILGMTRMLEQEIYGGLTPKQREYVEVISQSGQTLLLQAQEIQSLSNLPQENAQDCILPTDLGLVAQNLIQQLTPIAQEHNIDLDFSTESAEYQWYGDPDQIRQILNHLLQGVITLTQ